MGQRRWARVARRVSSAVLVGVLAGGLALPGTGWADPGQAPSWEWYFRFLHAATAQRVTTGGGVTVAVLDTGVDASHPDLRGRVVAGQDFSDLVDDTNPLHDHNGHGTAMAGLVAANGTDTSHAHGMAPAATVLAVKVISSNGTVSGVAYSRGIRYATDHGAKVINLSLGGSGVDTPVLDAISYALHHDVVVVAAAGNTQNGPVESPALIPGVIAVTGLGPSGDFWTGSSRGPQAVLSAPAEEIQAPAPVGLYPSGYLIGDGTSASSALVSGVAALVRAHFPKLNAANVINRLIRTADDKGPKGRDDQYGFGVVDPVRALTATVAPVTSNPLGDPSQIPPDELGVGTGGNNDPDSYGGGAGQVPVTGRSSATDGSGTQDQADQGLVDTAGWRLPVLTVLLILIALAAFAVVLHRRSRAATATAAPPPPPASSPPGPAGQPTDPRPQPSPPDADGQDWRRPPTI